MKECDSMLPERLMRTPPSGIHWKLLHVEEFETRYEALMMERKLKGWSRAKKLAYIAGDWNVVNLLSKGKHEHERKA